jgi:YVTN family beta-propeller protein
MRYELLGGLAVRGDGGETVRVGGPTRRALLAILLLHAGEVLNADRLIDELWGERAPPTASKSLQVHVWRLRQVLGGGDGVGPLASVAGGYLLHVEPGQLDLEVFERLLGEGRAALADGRPEVASETLTQALALWNGPALAEFAGEPFAREPTMRLEELRLEAIEARIDADLELGRHRALIAELESLVSANPLRERLRAQLMLALYRCGRQAEALEAYRETRKLLDQELGLQPSSELRALESAMLAQDPQLDLTPNPAEVGAQPSEQPVRGHEPSLRTRGARRGGLLIAAGGALLVAAAALVAIGLSGGSRSRVEFAPNSVAVIDPHSNTVVEAVNVGIRPGGIAFGSGSVWVANADDQTISRINPTSLHTTRNIPLDGTPTGIAASRGAIWVAESVPRASSVAVQRVDPEFNSPGRAMRIGNVDPGGPAAISSRGNAVWVAPSSGLLTPVDAVTGQVGHAVDPNAGPAAVDVGDGAVWVTDGQANNVTRVEPTGLVTQIPVGNGPSGIAVGAGGVWVADSLDNKVIRIDPGSRSVTDTILVGRSPSGVAVGAGSVWVANSGDGTVTRINPLTNRVLAKIPVGGSPQAITVADGRVWVTLDEQTIKVPRGGGTLRWEIGYDFGNLDPAVLSFHETARVLYATCAQLLNYPDASGPAGERLIPEVARSMPALSADRRTYQFTIRGGFRFSPPSNQTVTAQTFKGTIERTLNPNMKSPVAHDFTDIAGARPYMAGRVPHISGILADGNKLTIHLRAPEANFLSLIAEPDFCAVPSDTPIVPGGMRNVPSAGPYYVVSYTPGQGVVLARNPNYHGTRPRRFARIEVAEGISNGRAVADVEAGTADYTTLITSPNLTLLASRLAARYGPRSAAAARGQQRYFHVPWPELDYLELNTHRPLFRDARLRQAVNYAINRGALAKLGDGLNSAPEPVNEQYLTPGIPGYRNVPTYAVTPDFAKARKLAGHRHRDAVLYTCSYAQCAEQAQIITNDLRRIGIEVHVKAFTSAYVSEHANKPGAPYDLAQVGWTADYPDPATMLWSILEDKTVAPTFDDAIYRRRLTAVGRLTGPRRYLAYGKLAVDLARNAAPIVAWGDTAAPEFFSARIGCEIYGFYGVDLGALCLTHPTSSSSGGAGVQRSTK